MKTKLNGILTLLLALVVQVAFAQQAVTGKVTDIQGDGLFGVTVQIKGTNTGVTSDFDGNFTITARPENVLVFSFTGYDPQEIVVGSQRTINVTMQPNQIGTVVVTGYRNAPPARSNVSAARLSDETIKDRPNTSLVQTLQGQVPGLNIQTASGQPGSNSLIQLRGVSSINGNTEPLFVIDGIPVDEDAFRSINQADIANIEVLKDAAGTAIYGNRGANGVILITTRRGSFNTPLRISYQALSGFTSLVDPKYELYDSRGLLELERRQNLGRGAGLSDADLATAAQISTDWTDVFFRTGTSQNHNLRLESGSENLASATSIGYAEQEGILVLSKLQRFNVSNNITGKSANKRFTYNTTTSLNFSKNNTTTSVGTGGVNQNFILGAYQSLPYISPDEFEQFRGNGIGIAPTFQNAPLLLLDKLNTSDNIDNELKIVVGGDVFYKITEHLTARYRLGLDYTQVTANNYQDPNSFTQQFFANLPDLSDAGFEAQSFFRDSRFNSNASLTYEKGFGAEKKNTILVAGYLEYVKAHTNNFGFTQNGLAGRGFFAPFDGNGYSLDTPNDDFKVPTVNSGLADYGLFSYFSEVDYDYDNKFGFTGTVRRDASARFIGDNRWATFFAIAGRWNIDQEDFIKNSTWINKLKLRVSYGTAGNDRIGGGFYTSLALTRANAAAGTGNDDNPALFIAANRNANARWETVSTANVGIDFQLFKQRLRGSLDVYNRQTDDLFQTINIAPSLNVGSGGILGNFGSLQNRGVDLQFSYDLVQKRKAGDFGLTLNFVGNYNANKILDLPSVGGVQDNGNSVIQEGRVINEFFNIPYVGVNPNNGNLLFRAIDGTLTENPTNDDRVLTGRSANPEFQGSFGFNLDYKNFYIETQWNYITGISRIDFDLSEFQDPANIGVFNLSNSLERAWTPTNRETDIPSLTASNIEIAGGNSDRFLRNSDFLRLRFASVGYNFPKSLTERIFLTNGRIFVNGENLLTFSDWLGADPESPNLGSSRQFPTPRIVSVGLDLQF